MDRCGRLLIALARLEMDERLVEITEQQAAIAERALRATLGEIGLDARQQADACERFGRHLRLVDPL